VQNHATAASDALTMARLIPILISLLLVFPQSHASPPAPALVDQFDALVAASMRDGVVPGLAAALVLDGSVVYAKGHGRTRSAGGDPVTERTRFGVGSVTKTFTAAAVLALQDDGRLRIDDPARHYLPELDQARDPRARLLTVRQLMSGRGCVPDIFVGSDAGADALDQEARRLIADPRFDLRCVPGQGYVYPNFGMVLAGLIVQRVSGMPFEDYVEKRLFRPLGMTDSSLRYWQEESLGTNAGHYRVAGGPARVGQGVMGRSVGPTGMASSSIRDMASYATMLLAGGIAPDGRRILSTAAVGALLRSNGEATSEIAEAVPGIETDYGLGWELNRLGGQEFVAKGGSTGVMSAYVVLLPRAKGAIIFLANLVDYAKLQIVFNTMTILAGGEPKPYASLPEKSSPPGLAPPAPALRAELAGRYETLEHDLGGFTVHERDGRLYMSSVAGDLELVSTSPETLTVRSDLTDFNGRTYTIKRTHGRVELWNGRAAMARRQGPQP
jgi:CubicO group peptidase (beta-lactamase class C family)